MTQFKNSETQYGAVTKALHWGIALIVIFQLIVGLLMDELPGNLFKLQVYNLHKSLGIAVLALMFLRILWHIYSRWPKSVETLTPSEKRLSKLLHVFFYILLIAMPLTGWLMSSAAGRTVHVFGLFSLPDIVGVDKAAAGIYRERHELIGYIIMAALGLHVTAALWHHFRKRDGVLKRMLPFALAALLLLAPATSVAAVPQWSVRLQKSSITFHPKQLGTTFDGNFDLFFAKIEFDPENLAEGYVMSDITLSSAHTGAADRDDTLKGPDWFDVTKYPSAHFEAKTFRKTGEDAYEAEGTLEIHGVTQPVTLPFHLKIEGEKKDEFLTATMDGALTLDRSAFQLGTGQWADTQIIANEVPVDIHLVAVTPNKAYSGK